MPRQVIERSMRQHEIWIRAAVRRPGACLGRPFVQLRLDDPAQRQGVWAEKVRLKVCCRE